MLRTKAQFRNVESEREKRNRDVAYRAALEGIVLLENDGCLPIVPGRIALFGAGARKTLKGGAGSGEVNERYSINVAEGLEKRGFTVTSTQWLDDYDREYERGLNDYRSQVRKKVRSLNVTGIINIMANLYRHPYGRILTEKDTEGRGADSCLYVIARQSGEGADRRLENDEYSLSERERENIRICAESFRSTIVVINAGASFDTGFMDEIPGINGLIHMGQLGSMGGVALAEILSGAVSPSGKLSDTWTASYDDIPFAREYSYLNDNLEEEDYREGIYVGYRYFDTFSVEPRYPFGFGLSYTDFSLSLVDFSLDKTQLFLTVKVENKGSRYSGKEVVQLYVSCPQSGLPKEYQSLAAFVKTGELAPGSSCEVVMDLDMRTLASYDEARCSYLLSEGDYLLRVGNSSRNTTLFGVVSLDREVTVSTHESICPVRRSIEEIEPPPIEYAESLSGIPRLSLHPDDFSLLTHRYGPPEQELDRDVEEMVSGLSVNEQIDTVVGTGLVKVLFGGNYFTCPGAVGSTTSIFTDKGFPNMTFADGPAGLRIQRRSALKKNGRVKMIDAQIDVLNYLPGILKRILFGNPEVDQVLYQFTTAFPVETSLAQTWNTDLLEEMGKAVSSEMSEYGITFWLGPGLNIHRNPLCGRNYEYYSEDPLLSGRLAGAVVRGCQHTQGNYATLKHFVANNQEDNRNQVSSNINERALREIYLRGFEIALKDSDARGVMTSYNRLNGEYTPNSYDLCTRVLRNEWGFSGVVMTDWAATGKGRAGNGLCVTAGNDLIMPGGKLVKLALKRDLKKKIYSEEDLRRCAANVLQAVKKSGLTKYLSETGNL